MYRKNIFYLGLRRKNYLVTINGKQQQLPSGTEVTPVQGGKAVRIIFPEYVDNKLVGINDNTKVANITAFKLLAVKDVAGNVINNFGNDIPANTESAKLKAYDNKTAEFAKLTEKGVIKVRFDQPIGKANVSDFVLGGLGNSGVSISSVEADGSNLVTVKLSGEVGNTSLTNKSLAEITLTVKAEADNNITTTTGNKVAGGLVTVKDTIKPQVELAKDQNRLKVVNNKIQLPFSEKLKGDNAANFKYDLVVTNLKTGKVLTPAEYETNLNADGNVIEISFKNATNDEYKVSVKKEASVIVDNADNTAAISSEYLTAVGGMDTTAPTATVTSATVKAGTNVKVQSSNVGTAYLVPATTTLSDKAALDALVTAGTATKVTVATANTDTEIATTGLADGDYNVVTVNASDILSAKSTGVVTIDATAPTVVSSKMVSATEFQITFNEAVKIADTDLTNFKYDAYGAGTVATEATGNITSIAGDGTKTITVTVDAMTDFAAETVGTVDIAATVKDLAGNAFVAKTQAIAKQ